MADGSRFITSVTHSSHGKSPYISCMKINGVPLLPPLITDDRRELLVRCKTQAIHVELNLKSRQAERLTLRNEQYNRQGELYHDVSGAKQKFDRTLDSSGVYTKSLVSLNDESCAQNDRVPEWLSDSGFQISLSESSCNNSFVERKYGSMDLSTDKNFVKYIDTIERNRFSNSNTSGASRSEMKKSVDSSRVHRNDLSSDYNEVVNRIACSDMSHHLKGCTQNFHLSPCKDLVLKCDIFSSMNVNKVTPRSGEKRYSNSCRNLTSSVSPKCKNAGRNNTSNGNKVNIIDSAFETNTSSKKCSSPVTKDYDVLESPPRLIRQNSYTLEAPSPELLVHFEKKRKESSNEPPRPLRRTRTWTVLSESDQCKRSENFKPFKCNNLKKSRKSWNVEEAKQKWLKQRRNSINVDFIESDKICDKSKKKMKYSPVSPCTSSDTLFVLSENLNYVKKSARETVSTPISGVNVDHCIGTKGIRCDSKKSSNCNSKSDVLSSVKLDNITVSLLPEKDLTESKCNNRENINVSLSPVLSCKDRSLSKSNEHEVISTSHSPVSSCKDHSVSKSNDYEVIDTSHSTVSSCKKVPESVMYDNEIVNKLVKIQDGSKFFHGLDHNGVVHLRMEHHKQIEDLLNRQEEELQRLAMSLRSLPNSKQSSPDRFSLQSPQRDHIKSPEVFRHAISAPPIREINISPNSKSRLSCNRRLNFEHTSKSSGGCRLEKEYTEKEYTEKEQKAAVIISAYVKGYLVRKLYKTEKVIQIKNLISETIKTALNLHTESVWGQSDVEFHERLIIQVEAALNSLHEIFSLPVKDKMAIISADRELKKTKLSVRKPVLSATTQRLVRKRKEFQDEKCLKSSNCDKQKQKSKNSRRRSYTVSGLSSTSNSLPQSQCLQKSSSTIMTSRQPWK